MDTSLSISSISSAISNQMGNATAAATQAADDSFAKRLEAAAQNKDDAELKKACQEFEAIILDMMYKQMKATIIKSDFIEEDPGTEIFESMRDEQLMVQAAKTGTLGLAESLYKQLAARYGKTVPTADSAIMQESETVVGEDED